ncbi:hypothetical protein DVH24_020918, partial [Malus domestica]
VARASVFSFPLDSYTEASSQLLKYLQTPGSPRAERDAVRDGAGATRVGESKSMEVLLVRVLAMVRNVAVPARGSVEKLWCDDEGSMAVVLESGVLSVAVSQKKKKKKNEGPVDPARTGPFQTGRVRSDSCNEI